MAARGLIAALDKLPDLEGVVAALLADFDEGLVLMAAADGLSCLAVKSPRASELIELAGGVWQTGAACQAAGLRFGLVFNGVEPVAVLALAAETSDFELAAGLLATAFRLAGPGRLGEAAVVQRILGLRAGELDAMGLDDARLFELIDTAFDPLFFHDGRGFVLSNAKFRELVARSVGELEGLSLAELFGCEISLPSPGGLDSCELEFRRADGSMSWLRVDILAIRLGRGLLLAGIARDITLKRHLRALRSRFVRVASHELRSPLTVIRGYARLLMKHADPALGAEPREMLGEIVGQAERLTDFCNSLLDLSSSTDGQLRLDCAWVKPQTLVAGVVERQRLRAGERGVELLLEHGQVELPQVCLDALRIEQALTNLLDNAIKFSPEGGLVKVMLGCDEVAGQVNLALEVRDEGPGISGAEALQLFDEFYVGSGGRERGGFGLGLAITREIITAHGGCLRVEPASPGGHFIITIPLNNSHNNLEPLG